MRRAAEAQPAAAPRAPQTQATRQAAASPRPPIGSAADGRNEGRMAGLGRMIERMSGQGGDKPAAASLADRVSERMSARRKPNSEAEFDDLAEDSQSGGAEIPAFLRRQAN